MLFGVRFATYNFKVHTQHPKYEVEDSKEKFCEVLVQRDTITYTETADRMPVFKVYALMLIARRLCESLESYYIKDAGINGELQIDQHSKLTPTQLFEKCAKYIAAHSIACRVL
jgi:hypothetical protein